MLLAEIAATLWFLAFGAVINLARGNKPTLFEVVAVAALVSVCLVLSAIVMVRIIIRGLL